MRDGGVSRPFIWLWCKCEPLCVPRCELAPWHLPSWGFYRSHATCQHHTLRFPSIARKSPKCCKLAEPGSKSTSNWAAFPVRSSQKNVHLCLNHLQWLSGSRQECKGSLAVFGSFIIIIIITVIIVIDGNRLLWGFNRSKDTLGLAFWHCENTRAKHLNVRFIVARGFTGVNPSFAVRWEVGAEQFTSWQQESEKEDVPVSPPWDDEPQILGGSFFLPPHPLKD